MPVSLLDFFILPVLRCFCGAVLFRSLCPSPNSSYPFWLLALTFRSSRPAFCGRLTSPVSLRKTRFIQAHVLFTGIHLLKHLSAGFFALCRASPAGAAPVSSLFGLQRLLGLRHQLSFCKHFAASVAQCFFAVCARRQAGVSRAGFWV